MTRPMILFVALVAWAPVWVGCDPDLPQRRCTTGADCGPDEFCNEGRLCQLAVGIEDDADGLADTGRDATNDGGSDGPDDLSEDNVEDQSDGHEDGSDSDVRADAAEGCGPCGDGEWVLEADAEAECIRASPTNTCGGCGALAADPGTACGQCDDGVWSCLQGDLECVDASRLNACGGCGELPFFPGESCACSEEATAEWSCSVDLSTLVCEGDSGRNACGGCATVDGSPGAACTCGGTGTARWVCDDPDTTTCTDADDSQSAPRAYVYDFSVAGRRLVPAPAISGTIDGPDDVDWFAIPWIGDDWIDYLAPLADLRTTERDGMDYRFCHFHRAAYPLADGLYGCTDGECSVYLGGSEEVRTLDESAGRCAAFDGFDNGSDLYGCCATEYREDIGGWRARIASIENDANPLAPASGPAYFLIEPTRNEREDGCHDYTLRVSY